jgi:hypothetical protein
VLLTRGLDLDGAGGDEGDFARDVAQPHLHPRDPRHSPGHARAVMRNCVLSLTCVTGRQSSKSECNFSSVRISDREAHAPCR